MALVKLVLFTDSDGAITMGRATWNAFNELYHRKTPEHVKHAC